MKLPKGIELHGSHLRLSFYFNRKRYRESLGLEPNKQNIKFAENKLASIKYEISVGTFDVAKHFPNSKNAYKSDRSITFSELINEWLKMKEVDIRSTTLNRYKKTTDVIAKMYGASRSIKTLNVRSVEELRVEILRGRTARTANTYLSVLTGLLSYAYKFEYIDTDLSKIRKIKAPELNITPFSRDEISRAILACRHAQHQNIITVMVYSGIRIGELCALAWEDIDLSTGKMVIRRALADHKKLKTTKTDKERVVDLLPPAKAALASQKAITFMRPSNVYDISQPDKTIDKQILTFVFLPNVTQASTTHPFMAKVTVNKLWRGLCKRAGITYRTSYNLRHTYASWMLTSGVNISYLAKQMGHANFMMIAKVYGKWMEDSSKSESEKAWAKMQENMQNNPISAPRISEG